MRRTHRLVIALAILMGGLALTPQIALPYEQFNWQRYAAAYQPDQLTLRVLYLPIIGK